MTKEGENTFKECEDGGEDIKIMPPCKKLKTSSENEKNLKDSTDVEVTEEKNSTAVEETSSPAKPATVVPLIDICSTLPFPENQNPQRIEVKWNLEPIVDKNATSTDGNNTDNIETRWWAANLLPHDGTSYHILHDDGCDGAEEETTTSVNPTEKNEDENHQTTQEQTQKNIHISSAKLPVRVLDYDPYVAGGFDEREISRVVFLSNHSIMDIDTQLTLWFRIEGSNWDEGMPSDQEKLQSRDKTNSTTINNNSEGQIRDILDDVLKSALEKTGMNQKMNNLTAAQQCYMADRIVKAKERLLTKLMSSQSNHSKESGSAPQDITPEYVKR